MKVLQLLYLFQEKEYELAVLEEDRTGQEFQQEIQHLKKKVESLEGNYHQLTEKINMINKQIREKNGKSQLLKMKEDEYRQRLYGGKGSSKELEQLQKKINTLHSERDELEEATISLMYELDSLMQEKEEKEKELRDYQQNLAKKKEAYAQHLKEQEKKIEVLWSEIEKLVEKIEPNWMSRYQEVKSFLERPIMPVRDGICLGCRVFLTPFVEERVKRGNELVRCENCGRWLIWEE